MNFNEFEHGYTPANLRALLSSARLTQQQTGELLGVTTRTVAGWVAPVDGRGHHDMPLRLWLQLMQTVANMNQPLSIGPTPPFFLRGAMQITACPIALPIGRLAAIACVRFIAVHCSATRPTALIGVRDIHRMHVERGFACIGYHYVIKRDGTIERGRPEDKMGAHVEGHNRDSLGVCLIGGIDADGKPKNNFTQQQFDSLRALLTSLHAKYPRAVIQGHRDFFGDSNGDGKIDRRDWLRECPCFDVKSWWSAKP